MTEATNANEKALAEIQHQQNKAISDMKAQVSSMLTSYYAATEDASMGGQLEGTIETVSTPFGDIPTGVSYSGTVDVTEG